ncbi:MAG: hypothetical protein ABI439_07525 [Rhodospirillales bacterium]
MVEAIARHSQSLVSAYLTTVIYGGMHLQTTGYFHSGSSAPYNPLKAKQALKITTVMIIQRRDLGCSSCSL